MSHLRCAIYTRKSSEEGLEQSFNSLDAQREACEAYVLSQKSEGWKALPTRYDDGGFSGGKMERPALQRLLHDIGAGRVDVVVVYKVDRLTRSLADFAKIVEMFDCHGVSFISVTQAFNTTSSMGRLTLNVLLSFAQFEREVTGERIRDKIAASKAKGMWMGGTPSLGYQVKDRSLVIVPEEAKRVRLIFARYLALKSVRALAEELEAAGNRSKVHRSSSGRERGGTPFSRGALFHLLRNRIYIGEIVHKKQSYPGLHEPIVELEMFERVQRQLAKNGIPRSGRRFQSAPLTGLVFDAVGARMTPAHAYGKQGARYRYYVSTANSERGDICGADHVSRVSAPLLEELVLDRVRTALGQPASGWHEALKILSKVSVRAKSITLEITVAGDQDLKPSTDGVDLEQVTDGRVQLLVPACMQPRKGSTRLAAPAARLARAHYDQPLIAALKRSHHELSARGVHLFQPDLSEARGFKDPYLRRIAALAFLAPDIQRTILSGRQPAGLTLQRLTSTDLPFDWEEQRRMLGFTQS